MPIAFENITDSGDPSLYDVRSKAPGPRGSLPITPEMLLARPSGDPFGWAPDAGTGWDPPALGGNKVLTLTTHRRPRIPRSTPLAPGYPTRPLGCRLLPETPARALKG